MSKAPNKVYRATDPAVVEDSLRRYNEAREAFFDAVKVFGDALGHEVLVVGDNNSLHANHLDGEWRRDGLYGPVEGGRSWDRQKVADIPAGWHYYVKDNEVRPHKGGRTPEAKAAVEALAKLNEGSPGGLGRWLTRDLGIKGAPPFNSYGFEPVGDTFFVLMSGRDAFRSPYEWEGNEHFEPVSMSAYWLAKEQADAAAADLR